MPLINMDKIGANLMAAMGLSPDQVRQFVITVLTEVNDLKADRLAFRPASQRAYADVVQRLERTESKIDLIMKHLGVVEHERHDHAAEPARAPLAFPGANGHDSPAGPATGS